MKKIICILLVIAFALSFTSCAPKEKEFSKSTLDYFDTVCTVTAYDKNEKEFNIHVSELEKELKRYNELFDIYNKYEGVNNLYTLNELAGKKAVKVDKDIIGLLKFSKEIYKVSGGKTNIALGSVLEIWHEKREEGKELPDMKELKNAAKHTDINDVIIDEEASSVFFKDKDLKLDVGAIAKGYTADKLCKYVKKKGLFKGALINLGGNACAIGVKPDGSPWNIAIDNANENIKDYLCTLSVNNKCVITSADNQRYYTVDGKRYCHIIDPDTLMPADDFHQVTVICDNSALGDALSTTLFNMPLEEGKKLVKSYDGVEALWMTKDYRIVYSKGFKDFINEKV
ncbi:MAG: FAD:protein FMN transferase [Eubacterium sp.]|nr:FAD:protein FMN transferase [Eubacterium sp.]